MTARPEWLQLPDLSSLHDLTPDHVQAAIYCNTPGVQELTSLLSPAAEASIEEMARRSQALTQRHYGKTVSLYVPLYLSNHCSSGCVYCGFASDRKQPRHCLALPEVQTELAAIRDMGFEEVLLLTGERTPQADFDYLRRCVDLAAQHFHLVSIETFPMSVREYAGLVEAGCTGVTLYQESYDPVLYEKLHRWGPKKDYLNRLESPCRALEAGMRTVGLGALLGLGDPTEEVVSLFLHAVHLRQRFWRSGISLSFPRMRPQEGGFQAPHPVDEALLARIVFAFRIVFPDVPLVLSTRESPGFRDGMAGLGVSKMSAASRTTVGGYDSHTAEDTGQFKVSDERGVASVCQMLRDKGLEPVFKNWDSVYR